MYSIHEMKVSTNEIVEVKTRSIWFRMVSDTVCKP